MVSLVSLDAGIYHISGLASNCHAVRLITAGPEYCSSVSKYPRQSTTIKFAGLILHQSAKAIKKTYNPYTETILSRFSN
jgi:hypothetical protein